MREIFHKEKKFFLQTTQQIRQIIFIKFATSKDTKTPINTWGLGFIEAYSAREKQVHSSRKITAKNRALYLKDL